MKSRTGIIACAFTLLCLVSCVGTRTGVVQVPDASYLQFIGKKSMTTDNLGFYIENTYEAKIDEASLFIITLSKRGKDEFVRSTLYKITPGSHNIKVYRNGNLVINKNIYIGNQETIQIDLL